MNKFYVVVLLLALIGIVRCQHHGGFDMGQHYANLARTIVEHGRAEDEAARQHGNDELHPQASNQGIDYDETGKGGWWQGWAKGWYAGQNFGIGGGGPVDPQN